ncbi:MAG: transposase [Myxococcota bacterium]
MKVERTQKRARERSKSVTADKAYDAQRIRGWMRKKGLKAVIPERKRKAGARQRRVGRPYKLDRELYRRRNVVERSVGWLKENRRLATRYEKYAVQYLAMVHLAFIKRYLKVLTR